MWTNLNSSNNESNYVIGTVYRHPSTSITNFCEYLNEIFIELNIQMKHYFVLGDININAKTTNLNSSNFINKLSSNCSTSIIDIPRRVTCTSSTVLDHIITNENRCVIRTIVIDHSITNHFPIMAIIDKKLAIKNVSRKFVRSFKNFDPNNYNYDMQSQLNQFLPQLHTVTENDFNNKFEKFYSIIILTIEKNAPLKKLCRKQQRLKNKPWITKSLLISIKKKQKLHKIYYILDYLQKKSITSCILTH